MEKSKPFRGGREIQYEETKKKKKERQKALSIEVPILQASGHSPGILIFQTDNPGSLLCSA